MNSFGSSDLTNCSVSGSCTRRVPLLKIALVTLAGFTLTKAGLFPLAASRGFSQVRLRLSSTFLRLIAFWTDSVVRFVRDMVDCVGDDGEHLSLLSLSCCDPYVR